MKKRVLCSITLLLVLFTLSSFAKSSVAHAASITLGLGNEYFSNDAATFSINSDVAPASYSLLVDYSPDMNNASSVADSIAGDATTYSQTFDSSIGYRYFELQAFDQSGNVLATSNVVGLAKYQSGLMVQMETNQTLSNSYPSCDGYTSPTWFMKSDDAIGGNMVAPNFAFSEFVQNEPSQDVLVDPYMVQHVQAIRSAWGSLSISSGYRTPDHNSRIPGSASCSSHMYGKAVDFPVDNYTVWSQLCQVAAGENPGYIEPWSLVQNAPHVHADWGPQRSASCS